MSARDEVLARIRAALAGGADSGDRADAVEIAESGRGEAPGYRLSSGRTGAELVGLFTERVRDYGAAVRECGPDAVPAEAAAALAARGARRVLVPPGLDLAGAVGGAELVVDDGLSAAELDRFDAVVTMAAAAIAETGTIVLDGGPGQGRRALSLVPDYHLCIVAGGQVVGLVTEAVAALSPDRPLTWISGPSATSDIELDRVQGVHGPRTLEVILVIGE
ncbi:MAG TPA: LUD domain-containing protein [Streptosporangiaceae bacterium]|nr:LUD domain-containing protein [Streptosporangiaceae bacterium]